MTVPPRAGPEPVRVETFADHEVLHPPHRLKHALRTAGAPAALDLDAIARAEQALAALAPEFEHWMQREVDGLDRARLDAHAEPTSHDRWSALFRAAHDIKGEGATLGHPVAARVADSLCRLIEGFEAQGHPPLDLVDTLTDAVRAIVREAPHAGSGTADALAGQLDGLVETALRPASPAA